MLRLLAARLVLPMLPMLPMLLMMLLLTSVLLPLCAADQDLWHIPLFNESMPILPAPPTEGLAATLDVSDMTLSWGIPPRFLLLPFQINAWRDDSLPPAPLLQRQWLLLEANDPGRHELRPRFVESSWPAVHSLKFTTRFYGVYPKGHPMQMRAERVASRVPDLEYSLSNSSLLHRPCQGPCQMYLMMAPSFASPNYTALKTDMMALIRFRKQLFPIDFKIQVYALLSVTLTFAFAVMLPWAYLTYLSVLKSDPITHHQKQN